MLVRPSVRADGAERAAAGDLLDLSEVAATLTTVGAGSILASHLARGILDRSGPVGAYADTLDTVPNIIAAMAGNNQLVATGVTFEDIYQPSSTPTPGATFRFLYINTVAFAMTLTGNVGITLGSNVNVAASLVREYLFAFTNTTPMRVILGTMTNGSSTLTGLDITALKNISTAQLITAASGIAGGTLVGSVNAVAGTVAMSANATVTQTVAITFNPTMTVRGLRSSTL